MDRLIELRKKLLAEFDGILAVETPTGDQLDRAEAIEVELKSLDKQIQAWQRQAERRAEQRKLEQEEADASVLEERRTDPDLGGRVEVGRDRRELEPWLAGDFFRAVRQAYEPGSEHRMDMRLAAQRDASGMNQAVGAEGGFLVPNEVSNAIWDGMNAEPDNLLSRTDQYTVTGESITFPANAETSRATGSRWGGARAYWLGEADQITSSKPTFRQVKIEPQQLAVLVYCTDKLLRNSSVALGQYVERAARAEINFLVNDALVNGDGVGKPLGILSAACAVTVSKETGQAADTVVYENIVKMWSRLHPRSHAGAVWHINQEVWPQLQTMSMAVGTGGVPVYLPPGGATDEPYGRLFGRPVIPIEYCAKLGDAGDIVLTDWSAYVSGVQGGIEAAMSMHLRFDYAETAYRFMFAVDGQPWLASAITPYKATSGQTLSSVVTLAARA